MTEEEVVDPVRRQRMTFREDGDVLCAEVHVSPGGDVPAHWHPAQEERFEVIAGTGRFRVGRTATDLHAGQLLSVPARTTHSFKNTGDTDMRLLVEVEPRLRLQEFLEEAARLAREGKYSRRGIPHGFGAAVELAALLEHHRDEVVMAFPPQSLQRLLLRSLARHGARRSP